MYMKKIKIQKLRYYDIEKRLKTNSYRISRYGKGNHIIFTDEIHTISIPRKTTINRMLLRRLIKENNINITL